MAPGPVSKVSLTDGTPTGGPGTGPTMASGLRAAMPALILAVGTVGLGQSVLFMFLPLVSDHSGIDPAHLTFAMAVGTALFLVGAPRLGRASDGIGRRPVLAAALGGYVASSLLLAGAVAAAAHGLIGTGTCFALLLVSRIGYGLTVSGIHPVAQAWVADLTRPEDRMRRFAHLRAGASIGRVLGPALAAATLAVHPFGPLLLLVLAPLPGALLLGAGGRRAGTSDTVPAHSPAGSPAGSLARLRWRDRRIAGFLVTGYVAHTAFGLILYTVGLFMQHRLDLSGEAAAGALGVMMTGAAVLMGCVQAAIARLGPPPRGLLVAGALTLAASSLGIALADGLAGFGVAVALTGAATALLLPAYVSSCSRAVAADEQGAASGMLSACHTLGYATGALVGGVAFQAAPVSPFLAAAVLALVVPAVGLPRMNEIATR